MRRLFLRRLLGWTLPGQPILPPLRRLVPKIATTNQLGSICPARNAMRSRANSPAAWHGAQSRLMRRRVSLNARADAIASGARVVCVTALAIGIVWWWLGAPVSCRLRRSAAGQKLYCVSYAPFRDGQDPLVEGTQVTAAQIEADLALLSKYTDCVRTYSVEFGLDKVPEIARRHGLKVLQGLWLSSDPDKNRLADRDDDRARQEISRRHPRHRRRQRGAAARRNGGDRPDRHHPRGQVAGARAGHLCGCVGVLAALSRRANRGRLRHHPHPAVLGGLPDSGRTRGRPCRRDPREGRARHSRTRRS